MKPNVLWAFCLACAVYCAGCSRDYYARRIIEHNTSGGLVALKLTGSAQQMIQRGRIDVHRRINVTGGIDMDVWIIKARSDGDRVAARGTVLILHGLTQSKASSPQLGLAKRLAQMGYGVVLPDLRAHGRSEGKYVTFGALERHDVRIVMDKLIDEGVVHPDVYVVGTNLGAATGIMYAADDRRCKGVVAIAPYKDIQTLAKAILGFWAPMMDDEDFQATLSRAGKIAGFDPSQASAVQAARGLTCPLLVIHGLLDWSVPVEQGKAVYDAAPPGAKKFIMPLPHEQLVLAPVIEDWLAEKIDHLAKTGLVEEQAPTSQPAP